MPRPAYKPKIYAKHKELNQSPAEWNGEHKGFQLGFLPTLYSPQKVAVKDTTDGYEAQIIHHPSVNTILQNVMPARLLQVQPKEEIIRNFVLPEPFKPPELTETQKLREEGKMLRLKDKIDNSGAMYRLGVNKGIWWNRSLDCGFKLIFFSVIYTFIILSQEPEVLNVL